MGGGDSSRERSSCRDSQKSLIEPLTFNNKQWSKALRKKTKENICCLIHFLRLKFVPAKVPSRSILLLLFFSIRIDDWHDSRGREGNIFFYSTLQLPLAHKLSDIYLQLWMLDDCHIFLIGLLVFTRLLLDEIYLLIEFDWLMMWCYFWFVYLFVFLSQKKVQCSSRSTS